ncbi:DUF1538 domain-containing protein [Bacillus aquiflavi]|uniref:DUF1538 domain-containing protein n=1 Tax=Bacillus aquiflavi TaxID=2672567 RepID=A0A6B3W300_9BACI|nr:DUF1538 domain-containing protein [Bacillus aquiflavi]MBA4536947.1 DUF1538 domain-containing protein [Bacillus aquiflavi]NEY82333.1 DUF1538 domain-containing protein [Bacillus aquiflavi]UAC47762.1 DUF1538 domain-containing protein [Bacillus aquiflavi]
MDKFKETFLEVVYAIFPVTVVVILLQFSLIWLPMEAFIQFLIGVVFVTIGLWLFLIGVQVGLLPIGELVGKTLPKTGKLSLLLFVAFLLGFVVTVAEPDVRVLATQVDQVSNGQIGSGILIYSVALGVGIFVALAMLRIVYQIPIQYLLIASYGLAFALSFFIPKGFVPISFDAGGVTTGPMTVPFIIALGVGVASVLRSKSSSADSFGLVGLASVGPILAVMILGVIYR